MPSPARSDIAIMAAVSALQGTAAHASNPDRRKRLVREALDIGQAFAALLDSAADDATSDPAADGKLFNTHEQPADRR